MTNDCTATASLFEQEARYYNNLPGGGFIVLPSDDGERCDLREHAPDTPHVSFVQTQDLPDGEEHVWWLMWNTTGYREIKEVVPCWTELPDPDSVDRVCFLPLGHGGDCVPV